MRYSPVKGARFINVLLALFLAGVATIAPVLPAPRAMADTATNVTISSATLPVNSNGTTDIFVNGVSGPNGVGAWELVVVFDRTKLRAVSAVAAPPFSGVGNVDGGNASGRLLIAAFLGTADKPTGNVKLATLTWTPTAEGTHPLTVEVSLMGDTQGQPITGSGGGPLPVVNGTVTATPGAPGAPTPVPTTPPPTAAPTTPPPPAATPAPTTPAAPPAPTTPPPGPTTPAPTGAPTTPPVAGPTTVEVGAVSIAPGASAVVPITVKNFNAASGLGSYEFTLRFRPEGIRVDAVRAGDQPFGEPAAQNINNNTGTVQITDFTERVPGPRGNTVVASLAITGVAAGTWPITLTVGTLSAANGDDVPATIVSPNIVVGGAPAPGATPPPPPPPPTPAPTAKPSPAPTTPTVAPSPKPKPTTPAPKPTPVLTSPPAPKPTLTAPPPTPKPTTPAPTPTPAPPAPSGPNMTLIIGIIVLVIVIVIVVVMVTRKKPAPPE